MIIGITGSIGSGKTTVAKIFSKHWYTRIDADEIGHELIKSNKIIYKKLVKEFGKGILDSNKKINRKKLGKIVFNDVKKLKKLNSIIHPKIINAIKKGIIEVKKDCHRKPLIVIDAPLLLETKAKKLVDKVIVVKSTKKIILKRNKKFPGEKIERILNAQMPLEKKLKHADFVITNDGTRAELEKQSMKIIQKIK